MPRKKKFLLMSRKLGSREADFYPHEANPSVGTPLTFPEKLALIQYMPKQGRTPLAVFNLQSLLDSVHSYHSHYIDLYGLKQHGSESGIDITLREDCGKSMVGPSEYSR